MPVLVGERHNQQAVAAVVLVYTMRPRVYDCDQGTISAHRSGWIC